MRLAAALSVLVLGMSACSDAPDTGADVATPAESVSPASSPSPSLSPSPSPVAAQPTLEQAAATYLALVTPFNEALNRLYDYLGTTGDVLSAEELAVAKPLAVAVADANRAFGIGLQQAQWPEQAQPTVDELAAATAAAQAGYRTMADAQTVEMFLAAEQHAREAHDRGAASAELLRQKLGLPETRNTDVD